MARRARYTASIQICGRCAVVWRHIVTEQSAKHSWKSFLANKIYFKTIGSLVFELTQNKYIDKQTKWLKKSYKPVRFIIVPFQFIIYIVSLSGTRSLIKTFPYQSIKQTRCQQLHLIGLKSRRILLFTIKPLHVCPPELCILQHCTSKPPDFIYFSFDVHLSPNKTNFLR